MAGVDIESGDVLWSRKIKAFRGMNILTPVSYNNKLFTSAHSGVAQLFSPDKSEPEWTNRSQAYMSSPLIIGDHAYMHLKKQRVVCIDLKTGTTAWTSPPVGQYWSMVKQQDKILALDERGTLHLMKATPKAFSLIESRELSRAQTWAHLASAGDMLVIREQNALVAYRWK